MGLVKCPDCGKEFSDRIEACPNCFCPIDEVKKNLIYDENELVDEKIIEKKSNNNLADKSNKLSSEELFEFSVKNVMPYIIKELGGEVEVRKGCKENDEPDFFLETPSETIGLNFVVDIAPYKSTGIYNRKLAEALYDEGIKFAVAKVGVGASDSYKFERRILEKNDSYYFNYEELTYFDVEKFRGVQLMLGPNLAYKEIYNRKEKSKNTFRVQKPDKNYIEQYADKSYVEETLNKYNVNEKFYVEFFKVIGLSINYRMSFNDLVVNFLNCVDIIDGVVLSDSISVKKNKIIVKCIDYLEKNTLLELENYDVYWLAFYVYYYVTSGRENSKIFSVDEFKNLKIELYEKDHSLFGFKKEFEELDEFGEIETKKNTYNLNNYYIEFCKIYRDYSKVSDILEKGNRKKLAIEYSPILNDYRDSIKKIRNYTSRVDGAVLENYKNQFYEFKDTIDKFEDLIYLESSMMVKLSLKAKGSKFKYGFFEHKKDEKKLIILKKLFSEAAKKLISKYDIKKDSKDYSEFAPYILYIVEDLFDDYLNNLDIKDELENKIKQLEEISENISNKKVISDTIDVSKKFLQLVKEEISDEKFYEFEKETLISLKRINSEIYDCLISGDIWVTN